MSKSSAKIYGIDLGTTYSCIACVDEYGKPVVLRNLEGDSTTPSVVHFDGDSRVVGKEARNVSMLYPERVVSLVKREMGTGWRYTYQGQIYSPEEISSYILRKLAADVRLLTQQAVTDVVITCPAYFGNAERSATQNAGELAGFKVRAILNEPTAAALAYGMGQEKDMRVLVYDLGGGTFDVTVIEVTADAIDVVATGGNHRLGGRDWDTIIASYLADQWKDATGSTEDPLDHPETLNTLYVLAEDMKRGLTARDRVEKQVSHAGQIARVALTRELFDELTRSKLEETIAHTRLVLKQAETLFRQQGKPVDVLFHRLLLVGGSTRMPQVTRRLKEEFPGAEPQLFDPDESVAKGAALYGQKLIIAERLERALTGRGLAPAKPVPEAAKQAAIQEVAQELGLPGPVVGRIAQRSAGTVTSCSYGVEALMQPQNRWLVSNLITVNAKLPLQKTDQFYTLKDNQTSVTLPIMENRQMAPLAEITESRKLGECVLPMPPGLPKGSPLFVTFNLGTDGILHMTGFDPAAKRTIQAEFRVTGLMTEAEAAEAKRRAGTVVIS